MASSVTAYTSLYPLVVPELPGIETVHLLQEFRNVGRDFCRRSEAWREELSPVNIVADKTTYALPMEYDVMVLRIVSLKTGGTTADPISASEYELVNGQNTVVLDDAPSSALTDGLIVKVVLMPHLFTDDLAAHFMEKWGESICAGVKAAFMRMPNKKWSNDTMADQYAKDYAADICWARFDNEHNNKTMNVEVEYNNWAV